MKRPQGPRRRGQSAATPTLYAAVAKELTNRASIGRYLRGELIPTEFELSKELRVSRQTIREAIRLLADAGHVSRHPGIGTRVRAQGTAVHCTYPDGSLSDIVEIDSDEMPNLESNAAMRSPIVKREIRSDWT